MNMNVVAAVAVLVVIAVVFIGAGALADRARKRRVAKGEARAKAQADANLAAEARQEGSADEPGSSSPEQKPAGSAGSSAAAGAVEPVEAAEPSESASTSAQAPESKGSRATRLRARLSKSANPFGRALFNILAKDQISESDWEEVEDTLLLADVGSEASEELVARLRRDARITGSSNPEAVHEALYAELLNQVDSFGGPETGAAESADMSPSSRLLAAEKPDAQGTDVIIMVGVNGTGKTTTAGKLARLFVSEGKSVMLAAADTFRAAAADQLQTWGSKVGVPVVRAQKDGADPASVAFEASRRAKAEGTDVLIIDTAGRLQNKSNLMDQLGKIRRVTEKNLPVSEVLLVLDATTGQNGMEQAKVFAQAIGITGVVLTKLDGSAKGGIVISVQRELGVPVKLVGLGEGPDDLAPFDATSFVKGILA